MRILHVSHLYHPSIGGNQIQNQGLSETLAARGDEVTVFTTNALLPRQLTQFDRGFVSLPKTELIHDVTVRRFTPCYLTHKLLVKGGRIISPVVRWGKATRLRHAAALLRNRGPFVPQMLWAIRRFKPDLIQAHGGYPATTYFCYLARKYFGFPLVIRPTTHVAQGWHTHPMQLEFYRTADLLIASTPFEKRVLIEQGVPARKIVRIGNAINPEPFLRADATAFRQRHNVRDGKIVAFVARKAAGKGAEHLIDAMGKVWKEMPSACLVLAGKQDSAYAAVIKKRVDAVHRSGAGRIIDIDDFAEAEKPLIFAACDVFAMTSNTDSFGIVYLEAWASGKPVVACKNTPQETIIAEGRDGLLVEYGNVRELAQAILRLLADNALRSQMGAEGRKKVLANYTWDIVAAKVRGEYRKLVQPLC